MNRKPAFSLVEMLVAMALIAMMIGLTATGYKAYNQKQKVTAAVSRIRQVMNEAKANATADRIDCSVCGGADHNCDGINDLVLTGWRVRFSLIATAMGWGTGSILLDGMCGGSTFPSTPLSDSFPNIQINNPSAVIFKSGGAGTNLAADMTINVRWMTDNSTLQTVVVKTNGLVQ